ncbi:F-box protein pof7 [Stagonosporopsis vannaccii]|nr:F-box protein pof7 [Stagonosporopsis vannaccii]
MDPQNEPTSAEAELESFRQRWREEVSARAKGKAPVASAAPARTAAPSANKPHAPKGPAPDAASHSHARQRSVEETDEVIPYAHQDLGEKQHGRRLDETIAQSAAIASASKEPKTALDHYEKAVERETQGNLGDSVRLYRKAFKLDDSVHEKYKAKHFPPSFFKNRPKLQPQEPNVSAKAPKPHENPNNAPATVPSTAHHSLHGLSPSLQTLLTEFSTLSISGESPPTDLSPAPPCPIASLPEEILVQILEHLAVQDLAAFVRLAQVCKRLAYLVNTEDQVWKRLVLGNEYGFAAMHYSYTCQIDGRPLGDDDEGGFVLGDGSDEEDTSPTPPSGEAITQMLVPSPYPTYRTLFYRRPRIRFNGCYISTVNYQRSGAASTMSLTWGSPIHIVTYYRYLRFHRDGTCISLLTTSEPADVVPYLYIEHMHRNHGNLPSAPMKDALLGRWRLSGPEIPGIVDGEKEGTLIIETAGATPKYFNKMMLSLSSAGRHTKNNKLTWQGYWSYNRLTDDWGEFGLKNDRAFYWSRVKSYGMSWGEGGRKDM